MTTTTTALVSDLAAARNSDWTILDLGTHVFVNATAEGWFFDASDLTSDIVSDFARGDDARLIDTRGYAYARLCDSLTGLSDEQVPADVLQRARDHYDTEEGESVSFGW